MRANCKRLKICPGTSRMRRTGSLPRPETKAHNASITALSVALPGTISTAGIKCGGLAKCATATRSVRVQAAAISSTARPEVELARIAVSGAQRSTDWNNTCFAAMSSAMASITNDACRTASCISAINRKRARHAPQSGGSKPAPASSSYAVSISVRALSRLVEPRPTSTVSCRFSAAISAILGPMVPVPTTATLCVFLGMVGISQNDRRRALLPLNIIPPPG